MAIVLTHLSSNHLLVAATAPPHHLLSQVALEILGYLQVHETTSETDYSLGKHPPQVPLHRQKDQL